MPNSNMTRRSFLAASAAATAIALKADAGVFTGKIKKAVKYYMIKEDLPLLDKFKLLQDLGYDAIEIGYGDKVDPKEVVKARDKTGLPVHGVVLGSVNGIHEAIDRAKLYGATSVLLVAGRVNESMSYARNYTETQDSIRKAIPYAEKRNMLLLVENVWNNFLLSPLEMARYIDELDSPFVKVYFDIGNVVRFGYPEHWIPVLGKRIHKLDVKEYSRKKQNDEGLWKGFEVRIGDGSIDWSLVRRELAAIDYRGWATAEVDSGDRTYLADVAKRMDEVLDL